MVPLFCVCGSMDFDERFLGSDKICIVGEEALIRSQHGMNAPCVPDRQNNKVSDRLFGRSVEVAMGM